MLRLLKYTKKKDWFFALFAIGFIVAQVWLDLKMPDYMNVITQIAQGKSQMGGEVYKLSDIWANGGKMLLCAFGSMLSSIITGFLLLVWLLTFRQEFVKLFTPRCKVFRALRSINSARRP